MLLYRPAWPRPHYIVKDNNMTLSSCSFCCLQLQSARTLVVNHYVVLEIRPKASNAGLWHDRKVLYQLSDIPSNIWVFFFLLVTSIFKTKYFVYARLD